MFKNFIFINNIFCIYIIKRKRIVMIYLLIFNNIKIKVLCLFIIYLITMT